MLKQKGGVASMHAVIFAGGTLRPGKRVEEAIAKADLIIAADGGALTALHYQRTPELVVGDFDSLPIPLEHLRALGCEVVRVAPEKDETDSELAIQVALERGADEVTLLGGLGGARIEHTFANVLMLADFAGMAIRIVDGPSVCWVMKGPGRTQIDGQPGDLLSLFPLTADASGIETNNLYYALKDDTLRFGKPRGVSNVLTAKQATVSLESGLLLVVHTAVQEVTL